MRDYGKVHTSFWASSTLGGLSSDAKLLALYLLTSPHTNASGAFRLPDAYACEDLKWDSERFRNGLITLSDSGFIAHCTATSWVWICKFGDWNKPDNPNIKKAVLKSVESIPSSVSFKERISEYWGVSETVDKPLGNTPSPSPSPSPSLFPLLILDDGSEFEISNDFASELRSAYPLVDLTTELGNMRIWLIANKSQRKTRRGIPRFVNAWLSKASKDKQNANLQSSRKLSVVEQIETNIRDRREREGDCGDAALVLLGHG